MQPQNLFVGSLAYATTDDSLREFFSQIGEVKDARVITDRDTNRSRGFGFVEFADTSLNQKAIDELNGKELDGRAILVSLPRQKSDNDRGGYRNGGNRNGGSFRRSSY
jgi:RNA recognition motif-containing protein